MGRGGERRRGKEEEEMRSAAIPPISSSSFPKLPNRGEERRRPNVNVNVS